MKRIGEVVSIRLLTLMMCLRENRRDVGKDGISGYSCIVEGHKGKGESSRSSYL